MDDESMLSDALFWSGHQLCGALLSLGVNTSTISACSDNERVMGFFIVSWAAIMVIIWKLMLGRIK